MVLTRLAKRSIDSLLDRHAAELRPRGREGVLVDVHQMLAHGVSIYLCSCCIYDREGSSAVRAEPPRDATAPPAYR